MSGTITKISGREVISETGTVYVPFGLTLTLNGGKARLAEIKPGDTFHASTGAETHRAGVPIAKTFSAARG